MTEIKLTENNKENVLELFVNVYNVPAIYDDKLDRFLKIINEDLDKREQEILAFKYGLDGGGLKTLAEASKEFNVPRERIRQIEARAIKKLRHPTRRKYVFGYENEERSFDRSSELKETKLSLRTTMCLKKIGIITVNDLLNVKLLTLVEMESLGQKAFNEIVDFIKLNKDIK